MGNFLTDRPSSRVLAAPGGVSQIVFGDNARDVAATKVTRAESSRQLPACWCPHLQLAHLLPDGGSPAQPGPSPAIAEGATDA